MILFKLDAQGGFTCGDTETGRTAYAYPTSSHAQAAKKQPELVAAKMMANENSSSRIWRDTKLHNEKDAERMIALRQNNGNERALT
jgi:hypothetical protein